MKLECPYLVNQNTVFSCKLSLKTAGDFFNISIDFGDGEIRVLEELDNDQIINKTYSLNGTYTIKCNHIDGNLTLNPIIFGIFLIILF